MPPRAVFHVSKLTQATKTKHISSLFTPHQSIIKWIDDHGVLVLIPKISYEVALRACCLNNPKGFTIVPLSELQAAVEAKAAGGSRANWRGRIGPNTMLPGQGELRFMLAQMVSQAQKAESDAAEAAAKRREGLDDEDLDEDAEYQRWLVSRWASSGPIDAGLGAGRQDDPFWHEEKAARRVKSLIEAEKMDDWEQENGEGDDEGDDDSPAARSCRVQVASGAPPAASAPAAAPSETTTVGGGDSVEAASASGSTQANVPAPSVE
jgi:hypothetical protein